MIEERDNSKSEQESESEMSEEGPVLLLAKGAAAFSIVDVKIAQPMAEAGSSHQDKYVFICMPDGIRRLWAHSGEQEHMIVRRETAQRYGLKEMSRRQVAWITDHGPTGVTVCQGTDYEVFLLADGPPGRTIRILAHEVKSVEEFCSLPVGTPAEWDIQLDRTHRKLLKQLS
jgi:hypothetical protein